jgi:hypothetical protein
MERKNESKKLKAIYRQGTTELLPFGISKIKMNQNGDMKGFLWVLRYTGESPASVMISTKIKILIRSLKYFHNIFMSNSKFEGLRSKESIKTENLFKWLHDILMTKGKNKFPLFGDFVRENRRSFDVEPLSWSDFSEVQTVLIYYFSDIKNQSYELQVPLYLLGYWYKEQERVTFNAIFKDDHMFWQMTVILFSKKLRET